MADVSVSHKRRQDHEHPGGKDMKAISLWGPWATWVCMKWKTIETRNHDRFKGLAGQRIVIHATQKIDSSAIINPYLPSDLGPLQIENLWRFVPLCRGKLLCTATVKDAAWAHEIENDHEELNRKAMCGVSGKFLLFLEDIQPLRDRIPYRGRQGIFNVPDHLIR